MAGPARARVRRAVVTAAIGASLAGVGALGRVQRAALVVLLIRVAGAGLAFLTQLLLARTLGVGEYGVFAAVWIWITILGHGTVWGTSQAVCRFVPEHRARGELAEMRGCLAGGAAFSVASALVTAGLGAALLWLDPTLVGPAYHGPILLALAVLPLFALQDFAEGAARSLNWPALAIAPVYVLRQGLVAALLVAAVAFGAAPTATAALAALLVAVAVALSVQVSMLVRRLRRTLPAGPRAYQVRRWAAASLPMALVDWTVLALNSVDVVLLSLFCPPETVALYFAATRILQLPAFVPYAASAATMQSFAEARARGAEADLRALVRRTARLTTGAVVLVAVVVIGAAPGLFSLFGAGFEGGVRLVAILMLGLAAQSAAGPAEDLLTMLGHERLCARLSFVALLAAVALHLVLIPALGATGAALATALTAAGRGLALSLAVRARLGFRPDILAGAAP